MCDPDSAGLSAELHDTTTWDFANFSCHLYLACSKWTSHFLCGIIQHNDRFPQGPPSQMGSPMGSRTGSETPQTPMSGVGPVSGGPGGFGRGSQGGNFEGPNKRRRY